MAYPPISTLPTPPSRQDPANFATEADAFLGALPTFQSQVNAAGTYIDGVGTAVDADATAAAASAAAAAQSAAAAAQVAGVWVSGTTYAIGDVVYSPITFFTYRRKTSGAGTTDPSADTTNWAQAAGTGDVTLDGTQTLTNKTLTSPTINTPTISGGNLNDVTVNGPVYSRDDDGTISGGTWAINYANGPVIKATAGANITSITMSNWPVSGTAGHLRLMLTKSSYTITFPSWAWIKSDLTTTTTFADLGLTLPTSVPVLIDLFSDNGGTTIYASIVRN